MKMFLRFIVVCGFLGLLQAASIGQELDKSTSPEESTADLKELENLLLQEILENAALRNKVK